MSHPARFCLEACRNGASTSRRAPDAKVADPMGVEAAAQALWHAAGSSIDGQSRLGLASRHSGIHREPIP